MSSDETHNFEPEEQPTDETKSFDRETRLDEIIAGYLKLVHQGQAPDLQDWLNRYPDHAEELAAFFADREQMEKVARPVRETVTGGPQVGMKVRYIGDYELLEELGRGGMGVVYKAGQLSLKRMVALKMILAGDHASAHDLARFRAEAEAIASLQHPNIVQIHEVGTHEGNPYAALEYVEGGSLAEKLNGTPLPARKAAELVEKLAQTVQAAHQQGIIHRDLKPANVLLTASGEPKIADFGLAKLIKEEAGNTRTGAILGTPSYMAPEQAEGKTRSIGTAADIYSLGAILYELLTGRPPFRAETPLDTILQVVKEEPVPPTRLQPKVPRDLETICLKCLQKDPNKRYTSAAALADDLGHFLAGRPITARPVSNLERTWRWCRRNPAVANLLAAVLVILVGAVVGISWAYGIALVNENQAKVNEDRAVAEQVKAQQLVKDLKQKSDDLEHQVEIGKHLLAVAQLQRVAALYEREPLQGRKLLYEDTVFPLGQRSTAWKFLERQCSGWLRDTFPLPETFAVCFSPDGMTLASGGGINRLANNRYEQGVISFWDVRTGKKTKVFKGHSDRVCALAFSPDGKTLASACGNYRDAAFTPSEIILWDVATGKQKNILIAKDRVIAVGFSPDGKTLASACFSTLINLWDVETGTEKATLKQAGHELSFCFSPDGKTLAGAGIGIVKFWDVATGQQQGGFKAKGEVTSVAYSPDGKMLAVCTGGFGPCFVQLWDVTQGKIISTFPSGKDAAATLKFSPDGTILAQGGRYYNTRLWDVQSGQEITTLTGSGVSLSFSPDGTLLASAGEPEQEFKVWEMTTRPEKAVFKGKKGALRSLSFSPDGKILAAANTPTTTRFWDVRTGEELAHFDLGKLVSFSPDGKTFALAGEGNNVQLWDVFTKTRKKKLEGFTGRVWSLGFNREGKILATGGEDLNSAGKKSTGELKLWDVQAGTEIANLSGHLEPVRQVSFSPDGGTLASAGPTLKFWDVKSRKEKTAPAKALSPFCFSPDGKMLAANVGFHNGGYVIKIWDVETLRELTTLAGHTVLIFSLTFSPDSKTLLSGDQGGTLKFWDLRIGQEQISFQAHPQAVNSLIFSPDGKILASADGPNWRAAHPPVIKLWDVYTANPDRQAAWQERQALLYLHHANKANDARANKQWFAAAFHLGKVADHRPAPVYRLLEAEAWGKVQQWERGALAYTRGALLPLMLKRF